MLFIFVNGQLGLRADFRLKQSAVRLLSDTFNTFHLNTQLCTNPKLFLNTSRLTADEIVTITCHVSFKITDKALPSDIK